MSTEMITNRNALDVTRDFFTHAPIRPLFWRPRFKKSKNVLLHAPLLFWLSNILKPSNASVIGVKDGTNFFLLCQAIDKLNYDGFCRGVALWQADGPAELSSEILDYLDDFYRDIGDIKTCSNTKEVFSVFRKKQDFLFIDLDNMPEDFEGTVDDFLPLLSDRSVLVIHGIYNPAVKVAKHFLSKNVKDQFSIISEMGHGLAILVNGDSLPSELQALVSSCNQGKMSGDVELIFKRLGEGLEAFEASKSIARELAEKEKALKRVETKTQVTEAELKNAKIDLERYQNLLAETNQSIEQLNEEFKILRGSHTEKVEKLAETEELHISRSEQLKNTEMQVSQLTRDLEQQREIHFSETATLTRIAEEYRLEASKLKEGFDEISRQLVEHTRLLQQRDLRLNEYARKETHLVSQIAEQERMNTQAKAQLQKTQVKMRLREKQVEFLLHNAGRRGIARAIIKSSKEYIECLKKSSSFDAAWYLEKNTDVREAGLDPYEHFATSGIYEGRDPSGTICLVTQFAQNPGWLSVNGDLFSLFRS